jgi:hypothetical protein
VAGVGVNAKMSTDIDLGNLGEHELEAVLAKLLIVKYPGVEREDIVRFFDALTGGEIGQVEQAEADLAAKSAQWKLAGLDLDT